MNERSRLFQVRIWQKTFTIVHGLEKHASPDLTGAKSHQKMMASLLDTYEGIIFDTLEKLKSKKKPTGKKKKKTPN